MEDLNFAIEVFKETNRTKELYRITWWTAQALKSRVGLFEGTYRKYHGLENYEKYLNDCVSASNEIMIASGGYSLYQSGSQSYRNLFKSENAIDAEIILARDYNNDLSLVPNPWSAGFRKFANSGTSWTLKKAGKLLSNEEWRPFHRST